jgi:hypothetical protein
LKGISPTPAFWEKRLEMIENKGREGGKEGKERCKRLQSIDNKRVERKSATQRAGSPDHGAHRG